MQVVNSSECPTGKHEQNLGVEIPLPWTSSAETPRYRVRRFAGLVMSIDLHEPRRLQASLEY